MRPSVTPMHSASMNMGVLLVPVILAILVMASVVKVSIV